MILIDFEENVLVFQNEPLLMITTQKMKFSIKDFFCKCDQIRRKLLIWSHLLKKCLMENFNFCVMVSVLFSLFLNGLTSALGQPASC